MFNCCMIFWNNLLEVLFVKVGIRVGIVVGENSGDYLAAQLMEVLQAIFLDVEIKGVVGPKLLELGSVQLFSMERLSIMGFVEPLLRLPELIKMRRWLVRYFFNEPPDFFIGVDAPEFNLGLEKQLRKFGIPTIHYVSPSIWAWRANRIHMIKNAVDLMLTLFPFEAKFYQKEKIPVHFVGHPIADIIPLKIDTQEAKKCLGYRITDKLVVLLPGSRMSEIKRMAPLYLEAATLCTKTFPELKFVIPLISMKHHIYLDILLKKIAPHLAVHIQIGSTYSMIAACDVALVTSGTATLEVMLHKKPMVICYKTNRITYEIIRRMIKVSYIGLPNLLADASLVPEIIQTEVTPEKLSYELLSLLSSEEKKLAQIWRFSKIHHQLRLDASRQAVEAIRELIGI